MQSIGAKLFIGVAITAIGMFGADNSLGTWKRNVTKSKTTTPSKNPIKSETWVIEASDGGVRQTATGQRVNGDAFKGEFTVKYDGRDYPVTGAAGFDTISMKQIDANTFTYETKKTGGKHHTIGKIVISKDGKTMTETRTGTNSEGKPTSATVIYDKQ